MNKNIQSLIEVLEDLLFDSVIFIFGISEGEYLEELKKIICANNRVFIIEPNEETYNKFKNLIDDYRINLLYYNEEIIERMIKNNITYINFNRLRVHSYGDYEKKYSKEYKNIIKHIDNAYFTSANGVLVSSEFKTIFLENIISNINKINKSTPVNSYKNINKNVPAIIVSAGPSLDQNIQTMLKYKEKLNNFFIIAGNRTLGSLLENGIIPNVVISVDAQYVTYEMIEKYIEHKIPLGFYEGSNKILMNEYKGDLIYIAQLLPSFIKELKDCEGLSVGGSVAHTCTDFAKVMGCNPIIFVGQDLAYTFEKHHSDICTFEIDEKEKTNPIFLVKNVYGEDIQTSLTLNYYKMKFEEYIEKIKKNHNIEFINCSYGAHILGTSHIELNEVFESMEYVNKVQELSPNYCIDFDYNKIIESLKDDIERFIEKSKTSIDICKKLQLKNITTPLVKLKSDDEDLKQFMFVYQTIDDFEKSELAKFAWGYVQEFIYEIREEKFKMMAKEYPQLTSDVKYQSDNLCEYFKKLLGILEEIKIIFGG